jgi:hypothetical protein
LIHITSVASPFYFKEKEADGQGIIFSTPSFFTPPSFALSYNTNHTLPQSKVYLSNLLDNGVDGLLLIDMEAVRMFGDAEKLYFKGIGNGLGGTPLSSPAVFSFDEERQELWISTESGFAPFVCLHMYAEANPLIIDWKFPTVYLQIVPITS